MRERVVLPTPPFLASKVMFNGAFMGHVYTLSRDYARWLVCLDYVDLVVSGGPRSPSLAVGVDLDGSRGAASGLGGVGFAVFLGLRADFHQVARRRLHAPSPFNRRPAPCEIRKAALRISARSLGRSVETHFVPGPSSPARAFDRIAGGPRGKRGQGRARFLARGHETRLLKRGHAGYAAAVRARDVHARECWRVLALEIQAPRDTRRSAGGRVGSGALAKSPAEILRRSRLHGNPSLIVGRRGLKHDEAVRRYPLGLRRVEVVKLYQGGGCRARADDDVMPVALGVLQNAAYCPAQVFNGPVRLVASGYFLAGYIGERQIERSRAHGCESRKHGKGFGGRCLARLIAHHGPARVSSFTDVGVDYSVSVVCRQFPLDGCDAVGGAPLVASVASLK